jgi:hypothetical protein
MVVLSIATASSCFAADSPWDGTWKLNEAKSKLTGDTFTLSMKGEGMYHYSNGSTMEYDFACDGKSYPTLADRSVTCTGKPETGMDYTYMAGETVLSKSKHTVSADGKTMTIEGTSMRPDGTTSTYTETYKRVSESKGMEGKWKNMKEKESGSDTVVIKVSGDMIHMEYPAYKETIDAKLDGSDAPVLGPTIPEGAFESLKAEGPTKVHLIIKYKTKVLDEGVQTLSADGKTMTREEWNPGKADEKAVLVYEKQ